MKVTASPAEYQDIFEAERAVEYPVIDAIEQRAGFAVDRAKLEDAARVLACPFKKNPPNWAHGRLIYALVRSYVHDAEPIVRCLDIGTAKGFSALCMYWAVHDECGQTDAVVSVDVIAPSARVNRNTVAECDGPKNLYEILAPWPDAKHITFRKSTGAEAIAGCERVHVCYLDGKHTYEAVTEETRLLAERQQPGDLVIWDDAQIDGVAKAIQNASQVYDVEPIALLPNRAYAIGTRRG